MSTVNYVLPIVLEFVLPIIAMIVGAFAMRRAGLLPAQKRLDTLLKDTIELMQMRVGSLEKDLGAAQALAQGTLGQLRALESAHRAALAEKDGAAMALQRAIVQEQRGSDQLRLQIVDLQTQLGRRP